MRNPYQPLTQEEKNMIANRKEEARKAREDAMAQARKCLALKDFQRYKEKYEDAREKTMMYIQELREPDPVRYAFQVNSLTDRLRSIGSLLSEIKKEAGNK